jgi:hypothetical protein
LTPADYSIAAPDSEICSWGGSQPLYVKMHSGKPKSIAIEKSLLFLHQSYVITIECIASTLCEISIVGCFTPCFHGFHQGKKIPSKYTIFLKSMISGLWIINIWARLVTNVIILKPKSSENRSSLGISQMVHCDAIGTENVLIASSLQWYAVCRPRSTKNYSSL